MTSRYEDSILRSLRKISRAIDMHSKSLAKHHELTGPQLVCLREIHRQGIVTPSALAKAVSLSQGTVTGILDRLAKRELVTRERSQKDRRRIHVSLTPFGEETIAAAPSPLHETFSARLAALHEGEQAMIDWVMARMVNLFEAADDQEASPILATGPAGARADDLVELFEGEGTDERE